MQVVFLFNRNEWNKRSVEDFLDALESEYRLRYGFGHILAICSKPIGNEIEELNLDAISHVKGKIPKSGVLAVWYDLEKSQVSSVALRIKSDSISKVGLEDLLKEKNNIDFDLVNFGFIPTGGEAIESLYESIRSTTKLSDKVDLLKASECEDLLNSKSMTDDIKKIILDFFTLRASAMLISMRLHDPGDVLCEYSQILLLTFITRAQFEKLILLLAKLDESLDFHVLDKSKKMKATFRKQAKNSSFDLTKKLAGSLEDVELLDDNYRTPETHKMGRILGLTKKGYFGTLINEVLSFQNTANDFFNDICNYLREKVS